MAEQNEALERLLAAISPVLASELDRTVQQTKEILERDFQDRLESAVREAEDRMKSANDAVVQKAIAEVRETAKQQVLAEFEPQFRQAHDNATLELRKSHEENISRLKSEASAERARLQEQINRWRAFAQAQQELSEATSQPEILSRFLKLAEGFSGGVAVYIAKPDGLALWRKKGQSVFPEIISETTTDPEFFFKPITVRGKTVAAVYAEPPLDADGLQFLVTGIEHAIEIFGMKLRTSTQKSPAMTEKTVAAMATAAGAAVTAPAGNRDDQRLHAEARRTARLLVAEIKLYHEQELKEGLEHSDIYQRLQKEIDHGREMYNQQVSSDILADRDYFHEELVRILTENEPSRLGVAYPGPRNA